MLVSEKTIPRERVGGGQRHRHGQHRVDHYVLDRGNVAIVPCGVGENDGVVGKRKVARPKREAAQDLVCGLERHVQQPIDRQKQKNYVEGRHQVSRAHITSPRSAS